MFRWLRGRARKRTVPRWRIGRFVAAYDVPSWTFRGRVQDLGTRGMCVGVHEAPAPGERMTLALEVLAEGGRTTVFTVPVQALWVQPWGRDGLSLVGFRFGRLGTEADAEIRQLLDDQALGDQAS